MEGGRHLYLLTVSADHKEAGSISRLTHPRSDSPPCGQAPRSGSTASFLSYVVVRVKVTHLTDNHLESGRLVSKNFTHIFIAPDQNGLRPNLRCSSQVLAVVMERSAAVESVPDPQESIHKVALGDLECPICLSLMCEPLTLSCGHSACRMCYCRSLQRVPKCPTCRAVCHIRYETQLQWVMCAE